MPTASAVVADVIDAVKHISARKMLYWSDAIEGSVEDFDKFQTSYYVRCLRNEKTAKLVASVFGSVNYIEGYGDAELSFITPLSTEGELKAKCEQLKAEGIDVYSTIRVIDL